MDVSELRDLRGELLKQQIRVESAKANIAELELARELDVEEDRQVKGGKIRHLNISGPIFGDPVKHWLGALEHWERRDPGQPISITINSPGGSVTDGLALFDTIMRLRRKGHRVTMHGQGNVMSMAAALLQAGDERILDERAKLMLHEGSQLISGETRLTPGEQEDMKIFTDVVMDDLLTILADRSNFTKAQIARKMKRRDWYMTAKQAVEFGFADRVE